jgi:hypothetical protein
MPAYPCHHAAQETWSGDALLLLYPTLRHMACRANASPFEVAKADTLPGGLATAGELRSLISRYVRCTRLDIGATWNLQFSNPLAMWAMF